MIHAIWHNIAMNKSAPYLALAAAAAFGLSTPIAKILLGSVSPWLLASLLYLGSGFGLLALILLRRARQAQEAQLKKSDIPWLAGTVIFGGILGPVLLMFGLTTTSATSASLLLNLEAVFTLLLAWMVFREHVDRRLFTGAVAIVAGAVLLSFQGGFGTLNIGDALVALACLSWGIDNNLTRKISAADPYVLASIKGIGAGMVNGVLAYALGAELPAAWPLAGALALGFVSYGLGLVLFIIAMRHLGTARAGAYYGTAPFIGALAALALLGENWTITLLLAGVLMAIGAWLHLSERHEHEHHHEAMDHDHKHTHDEHHQHDHAPDDPPGEPHSHPHRHAPMKHSHAHWPDLHHRHGHSH
jgi:drug/metabolite transporter (DMT)-like permease